jgi:hypothetical protein
MTLKILTDLTEKSFAIVEKTRGRHVHEYHFSEAGIDQIEVQRIFAEISSEGPSEFEDIAKAMKVLRKFNVREIRSKWNKLINTNNQEIKELLDIYFDKLYPYVFDKKGTVIFTD